MQRMLIMLVAAMGLFAGSPSWSVERWASPFSLLPEGIDAEEVPGVRFRGELRLPAGRVNGYPFHGLSGLAWDEDEQILYAISDIGYLFHLRPVIEDGRLIDVIPLTGYRLRYPTGNVVSGRRSDAEGLDIRNHNNGQQGDTELIVSFEDVPRLQVVSPTGHLLYEYPIKSQYRRAHFYASNNRSLEAVTVHPTFGVLAAPERPVRKSRTRTVPIFGRHRWDYPLAAAPNSSVVAMEALDDESIIVLERGYGFFILPIVISIRQIAPPVLDEPLKIKTLAVLNTGAGHLLDNFEGLTHHRGHRFFMVSDDNRKALQATLLVYFELDY